MKFFGFIFFLVLIAIFGYFFVKKNFSYIQNFDLHIQKNIVKIIGKHKNHTTESWGYKISDNNFIATFHSFSDFNADYFINDEKIFILTANEKNDIVIGNFGGQTGKMESMEYFFTPTDVGENIYTFVMREGKWQKIEGKILQKNAEILAFSETGKKNIITIPVLTDIEFVVGDSGLPIFNEKNNLVGMVHIENNF